MCDVYSGLPVLRREHTIWMWDAVQYTLEREFNVLEADSIKYLAFRTSVKSGFRPSPWFNCVLCVPRLGRGLVDCAECCHPSERCHLNPGSIYFVVKILPTALPHPEGLGIMRGRGFVPASVMSWTRTPWFLLHGLCVACRVPDRAGASLQG